ncbi:YjeF C-terminal domain carbohydrate kinase-like protein [Penicillium citrinum]|uniref:ATP-dependent (S)-NAD(P)H-hydrate dehydratase n=2 Tax=Penicillium TaxID=5073 RepID=A0A9W9PE75_PENCI|nr:YjeF C-terminal domain carbohydrate kinase-like protein [Penicillium citrinum]KAJ5242912.1 YjeF C-terminal domain carbohydrate kinase-like protein [Penicillium citrinum]KAJ5599581.1 YjeF C-terminal domain carbohydrate kinase-like protein [Penicillium hetheringtonii]
MEPVHHISTSSKILFSKARKIVPPMLEKFHKGQLGRVAVIGGCADYTGAPYFSAIASAKLGCDMSHVLCERSAAPVVKSYSPNLMVHPLLPSTETVKDPKSIDAPSLAEPIIGMLSRLHALVIGPGLGRDGVTLKVVAEVIKAARSRSIPFVLDADGLLIVTEDPGLVKGYKDCILTPNVVEFGRLAKALGINVSSQADITKDGDNDKCNEESDACEQLSKALGGVTIIQKGPHDVISNGVTSVVSDIQGGLKRSGGQGDTLTGSLGTLLAWRAAYHDKLWDSGEKDHDKDAQTKDDVQDELESKDKRMSPGTTLLLAAWAGSAITRECSRKAFELKGRSMQASDLTDEVHGSFLRLIGEPEGSKTHL